MRVQQFHPEKGKAGGGEPLPQELQGNDRLRAQLTDSKGIRAALLAEPVLKPRVPLRVISPASASIQRFEGRAGPVPGNKEYAAFFFAGELTQIADAAPDVCDKSAYQPFPELERL